MLDNVISQDLSRFCPALDALFASFGTVRRIAQGATLARQGEPAMSVYKVEGGLVRICQYTEIGDRKIVRFAPPGTMLGLTDHEEWSYELEAVGPVTVRLLARGCFEREMACSPAVMKDVQTALTEEIAARDALLVLVTCTHATERVLAFLHHFAEGRDRGGFVELPMGRHDIADHLGLSMETVSRAFSALRDAGAIELRGPSQYRLIGERTFEDRHAA